MVSESSFVNLKKSTLLITWASLAYITVMFFSHGREFSHAAPLLMWIGITGLCGIGVILGRKFVPLWVILLLAMSLGIRFSIDFFSGNLKDSLAPKAMQRFLGYAFVFLPLFTFYLSSQVAVIAGRFLPVLKKAALFLTVILVVCQIFRLVEFSILWHITVFGFFALSLGESVAAEYVGSSRWVHAFLSVGLPCMVSFLVGETLGASWARGPFIASVLGFLAFGFFARKWRRGYASTLALGYVGGTVFGILAFNSFLLSRLNYTLLTLLAIANIGLETDGWNPLVQTFDPLTTQALVNCKNPGILPVAAFERKTAPIGPSCTTPSNWFELREKERQAEGVRIELALLESSLDRKNQGIFGTFVRLNPRPWWLGKPELPRLSLPTVPSDLALDLTSMQLPQKEAQQEKTLAKYYNTNDVKGGGPDMMWRILVWKDAQETWRQNPWMGIGFKSIFTSDRVRSLMPGVDNYSSADLESTAAKGELRKLMKVTTDNFSDIDLHNSWLQVLLRGGLVVAVPFLIYWVFLFAHVGTINKALIIFYGLLSLTAVTFETPHYALPVYLVIGLAPLLRHRSPRPHFASSLSEAANFANNPVSPLAID